MLRTPALLQPGQHSRPLTNVDSDVFHSWVVNDLLLHVPQGSVIVMDNATFHKREDTKKVIIDAGHLLEYLPPYSPDLNPIEHKWAQAKAIRRKLKCEVHELFLSPNL